MVANTETQTAPDQEQRIDALLNELTLAEKVALLGGATFWTTPPIERLGIPALKMTDGPNGARGSGGLAGGSVTSACFPVGIALAATWNTGLIKHVGAALGEEARSKGAQILLAPTVNIHRSPLNGRNFECYSEDPYLSGRMAVAYISGVQSKGVGATVKHFVCNDSEFERNSMSSEVDERALRELYLPPFRAAVQEAKTWGVMAGYNKVNGTYASESHTLLTDILKNEWGFDGLVMSDWGGTYSTTEAVNAGLDLEMPGPAAQRGQKLLQSVEAGSVSVEAIDAAARRVLRIILRAGHTQADVDAPEQGVDQPVHRALIRAAGAEAVVLLKNERGILPLDDTELTSIAVIGPNAKTAQIMGGGSAQVNTHYAVVPYAGIAAAVGERVELGYAIGCTNHRLLPRLDTLLVSPDGDSVGNGFTLSFFNSPDLTGTPVHQTMTSTPEQMWLGEVAPGVNMQGFSARLSGRFTPRESGPHQFGLSSTGPSRLRIDGEVVIDKWAAERAGDPFFGAGRRDTVAQVELIASQTYALAVEYSNGEAMASGFRLGHLPPVPEDALEQAVALAARAEVALVFVGLNSDWESEGFDRPDMELVGRQNELVERVAAANPNTVVVLQTGSPVTMPWLDQVAAVIQAWYPGQECGNAIADVLFGRVNPSGKLPQTFPRRLQDNPAFLNYPGENGRVRYGEGLYVGYRWYERREILPLFPFGHGLSYTTFAYSNLRLSADTLAPDEQLAVAVDVTNTGTCAGQEVVQLYVRDEVSRLGRPLKELKGFVKLALAPGETAEATFTLDREALACWDDARHTWVAEAGAFELLVGSSSYDIRTRASFRLTDTATFGGPATRRRTLNLRSSVGQLLEDEGARAVLTRHLPGFADSPMISMAAAMPLIQVAGYAPDQFTEELLRAIEADLQALA